MNPILLPQNVNIHHRGLIGGKAYALAQLTQAGFRTPQTVFVTTEAYHEFVARNGLSERILLELNRKDFNEMRWEEIWDCATRIRNLFLKMGFSGNLHNQLKEAIEKHFAGKAVAVRSSAMDEDTEGASFAGLHESYLNVTDTDSILKHILLVWSSLWSDAALLYRQETGLDIRHSAMAVVLQETIDSETSGVIFSQSPTDEKMCLIESIYGLNQGLVDGVVPPDRWTLDRNTGEIREHTPATKREKWIVPKVNGVAVAALPDHLKDVKPLEDMQIAAVHALSHKAEQLFGCPQDVEWTYCNQNLYVLQSRPITTLMPSQSTDKRAWYLSLHRSFETLKSMRKTIENELIPEMIQVAGGLAQIDMSCITDEELALELQKRWDINQKWTSVYWEEFIPYAHGIRLFGQVYNDTVHPDDPFEFVSLLTGSELASLERNRLMMEMADMIRNDPDLRSQIQYGSVEFDHQDFQAKLDSFVEQYGDLSCAVTGGTQCATDVAPLLALIHKMAENPVSKAIQSSNNRTMELTQNFIDILGDDKRDEALELLALAKSSYRLRDDDNIHLGRIEAQLLAAVREAKTRVENQATLKEQHSNKLEMILQKLDFGPVAQPESQETKKQKYVVSPRQLVGQPAGSGLAKGSARVIWQHLDLQAFKYGEILVCDAVDPNMTFVVPLAAGVVERRGGMLIHGAIIAREYGLPCVTGIPDATTLIRTGDQITVDGFLGIVTISRP
jgi:pyruvate,water dikinase